MSANSGWHCGRLRLLDGRDLRCSDGNAGDRPQGRPHHDGASGSACTSCWPSNDPDHTGPGKDARLGGSGSQLVQTACL